MKEFECIQIREVWDFRLSKAAPYLFNSGKTWVAKVICNETAKILEEHDTGVPTVGDDGKNDNWCKKGIQACYEWLYSVRDNYSRDHIELRKPVVALINAANRKANSINSEMIDAEKEGNADLANQKRGELQQHLINANAEIKAASAKMHKKIEEAA